MDSAQKPFGRAAGELLGQQEEFLTKTGNVNYRLVAKALNGVHYETLRKAVSGDRLPTMHLIEQIAELVGVEPAYFAEYRLAQAQRQFDPKEVGFEQAVENLRRWAGRSGG